MLAMRHSSVRPMSVGLHIHDVIKATYEAETLRVQLRGWRCRGGCRDVACRSTVCGRRLENITGHQTFAYLRVRGSVSIIVASYKFARAACLEPPPSVAEELEVFVALVLRCEANL